jgi:futalosine hydrolase
MMPHEGPNLRKDALYSEVTMHTLPLLIAGATRKELLAALSLLEPVHVLSDSEPTSWVWNSRPFLLLVTGIGPINAAYALGRLIGERGGRFVGVLNIGIAGAFSFDEHQRGDPVIVDREIWPEFGLWTEEGLDPRGLGLPHGSAGGGTIWNDLPLHPTENARAMGLQLPEGWKRATSITVAGVSGSLHRAESLRLAHSASVENMEGFAMGWACSMAGLPFLELRVISNVVGDRTSWDLKGALGSLGCSVKQLLSGMSEE